MKQKDLEKKVQLLKAGQIVEIAGDWFQAVRIDDEDNESCCEHCQLDSLCRGDVFDVCCEMEREPKYWWYLKLAHPL